MIETISQGPTFKGAISTAGSILFVSGFIVTIAGIFSETPLEIIPIGIVLLFVGLLMFLSICGVLINYDKNKIKPYFDILIIKIGDWESLDQYDKILLKFTSETTILTGRFNSTDISTKSFDIVLTSTFKEELYIKEFFEYKDAKAFLIEYSKKWNKSSQDTYEIISQQIQERRKHVRK